LFTSGGAPVDGYGLWAGLDLLAWWQKKQPLPFGLLTRGDAMDPRPGALGQPGTRPLVEADDVGQELSAGFRPFLGFWLGPHEEFGLEANGFLLGSRSQVVAIRSTSNGDPLLALTHFDPPSRTPDAFVITAPLLCGCPGGEFTGGVVIDPQSQLWGAEGNLLYRLYCSKNLRLLPLAGLRYLDLDERITIRTETTAVGAAGVTFLGTGFGTPATVRTADSFQARNRFIGGQVGLRGEYVWDCFFLRAAGTVAVGGTVESQTVEGASALLLPMSDPVVARGGLYAVPGSIGRFQPTDFGIVPAAQIQGGVVVDGWLRLTFGYEFLYWSRVRRPGDQLDLNVDPRLVPTDPSFQVGTAASSSRPQANRSDFYLQGVTFGLEISY
jgi:hypothetical protein